MRLPFSSPASSRGIARTPLPFLALCFLAMLRCEKSPGTATCPNSLENIQGCIYQWALENRKTTNDLPTWQDLLPYPTAAATNGSWRDGALHCPAGGVYTLKPSGQAPQCSIGGNRHSVLPTLVTP
jgi:hypothetical protein